MVADPTLFGPYVTGDVPFTLVERDEPVRPDASFEAMRKLKPLDAGGTVTAGNAPGVNDGAAALVLGSAEYARRNGLEALGTVEGHAGAAWDPPYLALDARHGDAEAARPGLHLTPADIARVGIQRSRFAAVALTAATQRLGLGSGRHQPAGRRGRARSSVGRIGRAHRRLGRAAAAPARRRALGIAAICSWPGGQGDALLVFQSRIIAAPRFAWDDRVRILVVGAGQMGAGIAQVLPRSTATRCSSTMSMRRASGAASTASRSASNATSSASGSPPKPAGASSNTSIRGRTSAIWTSRSRSKPRPSTSALKLDLFRRLDVDTPPEAILASNTSSISITALAAVTGKPDRVIGMHFMNPVPVMQLVEVIRGIATSDATAQTIVELATSLGKTPVDVRDFPGFVANRILMPMINEAIFAVYEGVASIDAIDTVMKLGMNHPMGPLTLADFIGLDTCLAIMEVLYEGFADSKYRPCPLLKQYVAAGWYGKKTGRGFYDYRGTGATVPAAV